MKIHEEREKPTTSSKETTENKNEDNEPKYDKKMTYNEETRCYECNLCSLTFTKIPLLTQHMLEHSGTIPYACSICNAHYNDVSLLKAHMKNMHDKPPVYDKITVTPEKSTDKFYDIVRKHSRLYSYECHICGLIFNRIPHLTQHMTVHSGQNPYQCSLCNEKFNDIALLRSHMKTCDKTHKYLPEKGFNNKCSVCNALFNNAGEFADHLKSHQSKNEIKVKLEDVDLH